MKKIKSYLCGVAAMLVGMLSVANVMPAFADTAISLSPLSQKLVLNPGDTYYGSFEVVNQASNDQDLEFTLSVDPFFVNEDYEIYYEEHGDYGQMVDWITLYETGGTISPNSKAEVHFRIDVPYGAPAGGQYAAIKATGKNAESATTDGTGAVIKVQYGVAYTIYADIAGSTLRGGEILDANVPSFVFDGNIAGSAAVKNTGNVHGTATYTLKVFPVFSDEEVFTNEEDPEKMNIMPERTFYNETVWTNTPAFGVFNVVYTVEFEGETVEVSKMVIKCPIWMLFIGVVIIIAIVMGLWR